MCYNGSKPITERNSACASVPYQKAKNFRNIARLFFWFEENIIRFYQLFENVLNRWNEKKREKLLRIDLQNE